MGLGAYEPIGIQQGIAVCGTPRDVPSPRAGLDSWHYLTCFCQFIALSVGSKKVRVFIALRMKDREGPNQAVHSPFPRSSWPCLHPRGFYFLLWTRFVLGSRRRLWVVLNSVCVSTHQRWTSRFVRDLSGCLSVVRQILALWHISCANSGTCVICVTFPVLGGDAGPCACWGVLCHLPVPSLLPGCTHKSQFSTQCFKVIKLMIWKVSCLFSVCPPVYCVIFSPPQTRDNVTLRS